MSRLLNGISATISNGIPVCIVDFTAGNPAFWAHFFALMTKKEKENDNSSLEMTPPLT